MVGGRLLFKLKGIEMWKHKWKDKATKTSEVIVNLWYCRDREGFVYSLRAKPYVKSGSEKEKTEFLQERALLDYLIAESFEIPKRFHVRLQEENSVDVMPVTHVDMMSTLDSPIALFEDAMKVLESRFPAQSNLRIPQDPIVCNTPLMQDESGRIVPNFAGKVRYDQ